MNIYTAFDPARGQVPSLYETLAPLISDRQQPFARDLEDAPLRGYAICDSRPTFLRIGQRINALRKAAALNRDGSDLNPHKSRA